MKKSHIILLSIILFPSLLYLFFEMTQANFKKMPYYGPKTVSEKGDTVYYSVPDDYDASFMIDTAKYPIYIILFLNDSLRKDGYKLTGIYDYVQYKSTELKNIPIFFVSDNSSIKKDSIHIGIKQRGSFDSLKINSPNFYPLTGNQKVTEELYFKGKPYYVFNYFAVLVDKQRHIRGYYDPNQNSEIKRMVQEFKHLKTKDEYANTLQQNEIKKE